MSKSDGYEVIAAAFSKSLLEVFGKGGPSDFLNIPRGGTSLDIHRIGDVTTTTKELMLSFKPEKGFTAFVTGYVLFSDGLLEDEIEFIPEINGARVLAYHGNPMSTKGKLPYRLSSGVSSDLSNQGVKACNLVVRENDTFNWFVTNKNTNNQTLGIRFVGYMMNNSKITEPFTGG